MQNKYYLQSLIKKTSTAHILWIVGLHYLYLGKGGLQILYWITFGGFGVWAIVDIFTMSSKVDNVNNPIFQDLKLIDHQQSSK